MSDNINSVWTAEDCVINESDNCIEFKIKDLSSKMTTGKLWEMSIIKRDVNILGSFDVTSL